MDWTAIIVAALSGGICSGGLMALFTVRPQRKKVIAEARGLDMKSLQDAQKVLKDAYDETIKQLDKRVDALQDEMRVIRKKLEEKVTAIRQAYNCKVPIDECPVLKKQKQMEGETGCVDCDVKDAKK